MDNSSIPAQDQEISPNQPTAPPPNQAPSKPSPSASQASQDLPQTTPTAWYQQTINQLLSWLKPGTPQSLASRSESEANLQTSSTSAAPQSSTGLRERPEGKGIDISQLPVDQRTGLPILEGIDPQPDENGYPTNAEYLNALGFDPVEANRLIVKQQQQLQQIQELLANPQQRVQFLQEYDRQMQQLRQQEGQYQRPTFPGAAADGYGETPEQAFQRAIRFGNPVDAFDQVGQIWDQVPAQYLVEQILTTFPEID